MGWPERGALTMYAAVCKIGSCGKLLHSARELSSVPCDDPEGWDGGVLREAPEGGDTCLLTADSRYL